eukprot:c28881_g1_i1.p1 GENE.c28881_g1_i1~~c28881_g1_i1.p1  ORF type:complete len:109 (+),score=21.51 c28881_g1_i1:11-337(+)
MTETEEDTKLYICGEVLTSTPHSDVLHDCEEGHQSGYIYVTNYALCFHVVVVFYASRNAQSSSGPVNNAFIPKTTTVIRIPLGYLLQLDKLEERKQEDHMVSQSLVRT